MADGYLVTNYFTAAMTNTIEFKCSECGQSVVINHKGFKSARDATCLNCCLRYSHREQDEKPFFFWKSRSSSAKFYGKVILELTA